MKWKIIQSKRMLSQYFIREQIAGIYFVVCLFGIWYESNGMLTVDVRYYQCPVVVCSFLVVGNLIWHRLVGDKLRSEPLMYDWALWRLLSWPNYSCHACRRFHSFVWFDLEMCNTTCRISTVFFFVDSFPFTFVLLKINLKIVARGRQLTETQSSIIR